MNSKSLSVAVAVGLEEDREGIRVRFRYIDLRMSFMPCLVLMLGYKAFMS